ncbi:MAG: bifunctional nuclease family protein [Opitutales bacterium]
MDVVEIAVKGLMPISNGVAVFLGPPDKTFVINVDPGTGKAMHIAMQGRRPERPLTHELVGRMFLGFGISVERVIVNRREEDTFYARLILRMANEISTKLVELDARPSDSIVLALQAKAPIYVLRDVLDEVEDMSDLLERFRSGDD